jgi:dTDP-4-amino-4,6-dideoxygalactose transaminase
MTYKIPLFDINFDDHETRAVVKTIESKWLSMGPRCIELEKKFCEMFSSPYSLTTSNCTASLHLALAALGISEGDEVIVPSLTFVATVNSVIYVGATPVFADITSFEDLCIDPSDIERKITSKTKAIIVMHFAGFPCNMNKIMEIAKKNKIKIIEDACHGPLSEYNGKKLGTFGEVGCFSFFSNKNISTGEGGMVITDSEELYNKMKLLRSHGMTTMSYQRAAGHATSYDVIDFGYNYRMDDIRASIGIVQLEKLHGDLIKRAQIRKLYEKYLAENEQIIIPFQNNTYFVSNYIFPIVLRDSDSNKRDYIRNKLHDAGIQTSIHYPAVHHFTAYIKYSISLPKTDYVTDNEITLPMYSKLTESEIHYICDRLNEK